MAVYKCFKSDFEDLTKKVNRITKKLNTYGKSWTFKTISESIEEVEVWDYSNSEGIPAWQFTPKYIGKTPVEVVTYEFEMEALKLGDFEVLAVIDHNAIIGQQENIIHVIKDNSSIPIKYRTAISTCEHCNSNRQRNKTVLLQDSTGSIKQVGTSCIKEYTGIDGIDIIKNYQDIHNIIIEASDLRMDRSNWNGNAKYIKTLEYLAHCIDLINKDGYNKENTEHRQATKIAAWELSFSELQANEQSIQTAQTIIDYFKESEFAEHETFLNNIKVYISNEYTKISGFVAYAYLAYRKQIELEEKKQAESTNKAKSEYQGTIGEKIEIEVIYKKCFSYETMYGYQYIHLFEDEKGNVYKWKTNKGLWLNNSVVELDSNLKIKGTIKGHEEYNGTKQTELTRCKI